MKYGFCLLFCLPLIISAQDTGKSFKLNGTVKNLKFQPEMVYLQYQANGEWKTDSTVVNEHKYTFSGQLNEPSQARLRVKYKAGENGVKVPMSGTRDIATVFGCT